MKNLARIAGCRPSNKRSRSFVRIVQIVFQLFAHAYRRLFVFAFCTRAHARAHLGQSIARTRHKKIYAAKRALGAKSCALNRRPLAYVNCATVPAAIGSPKNCNRFFLPRSRRTPSQSDRRRVSRSRASHGNLRERHATTHRLHVFLAWFEGGKALILIEFCCRLFCRISRI